MNNSFLNKLTPRESKFIPLLKSLADIIFATSELMIECIKNYNHESAISYYRKIKEKEREGDKLSNTIFDELNVTFITPFDREDINSLAIRLDDVIDHMNSCAKRIVMYNPKNLPASAEELGQLIRDSAICIGKAINELTMIKKNAAKAKEYSFQLHEIENKADDVYENFVIHLFESEKDGIEIMKAKEIMYELEKATDSAEYVGKIIKTIIVKYA
ncbi:MAG: DUF47 family protein [Dysgonamonadaceae bacterium]|jgi:uncharacterized protein Yka (UPF0111/DUF47 family)|nr:DUF47 family protein [Dysgonamonadaceae bacterium]